MLFTTTLKALAVATVSALLATAAPIVQRDVTLASIHSNVVCPIGQTIFSSSQEGTVHGKTAGEVWSHIGDWCDTHWQGFYASSKERLDVNVGSASNPAKWDTWFAQAYTFLLKVEAASTGAKISWSLIGCTNNVPKAESLFNEAHARSIASAVAHLN